MAMLLYLDFILTLSIVNSRVHVYNHQKVLHDSIHDMLVETIIT